MVPSLKSFVLVLLAGLASPVAGQVPAASPERDAEHDPDPAARGTPTKAVPRPARLRDTARLFEVSDLTGHGRIAALREALRDALDDDRAEASAALASLLDGEAQATERADAAANDLVDDIRAWIEPAFDDTGKSNVDAVRGGTLLLLGTPEQQAWTEAFLAAQRGADGAIQVRTRLLTLAHETLITVDHEALRRHDLRDDPWMWTDLASDDADVLVQALLDAGAQVVSAPALVALPRQHAEVSVLLEHTCVLGYELRIVEPGATKIADPVIDTLHEGVVFGVRAVPLPGGHLGLDVSFSTTVLEQPIEQYETTIDPELPPVTFSLPAQHINELTTRLALSPGHSALLALQDQDAQVQLVVIDATTLTWDEAAHVDLVDDVEER